MIVLAIIMILIGIAAGIISGQWSARKSDAAQ